jgi:hypothetical protein
MEKSELKTAALAIRVRPSLKAELERLAAADKRSVAGYVEIALEAHVAALQNGQKPPTKPPRAAQIVRGGRRT